MNNSGFKIIVAGASTGGMDALTEVFGRLPSSYPIPIVIVQHLSPYSEHNFTDILSSCLSLTVLEATDKAKIEASAIYVAPPNYHLLVESDGTLSLSVEDKVNNSRPSIDILFESAARSFGKNTVGIILTGANDDGTRGLKKIHEAGGLTIVQDPASAYCTIMPKTAIDIAGADYILNLRGISEKLGQITGGCHEE